MEIREAVLVQGQLNFEVSRLYRWIHIRGQ